MPNKKSNVDWNKAISKAVTTVILTLIALSIFNFIIVPIVIGHPDIQLLSIEPKLIDEEEKLTFTINFENKGSKTASDVSVLVYTKFPYTSEYYQAEFATLDKTILQTGDIASGTFEFESPDTDIMKEWILACRISSREGETGHYWEYEITYSAYNDKYNFDLIKKTAP